MILFTRRQLRCRCRSDAIDHRTRCRTASLVVSLYAIHVLPNRKVNEFPQMRYTGSWLRLDDRVPIRMQLGDIDIRLEIVVYVRLERLLQRRDPAMLGRSETDL